MAFDLALATNGDLIISAAKDLQGAGGVEIIPQRILTRLRVVRGAWLYDPAQRLGSNLSQLFGIEPSIAATRAVALTREALRPMEDIEVADVLVEPGDLEITVVVYYRVIEQTDELDTPDFTEVKSVGISIPLGG